MGKMQGVIPVTHLDTAEQIVAILNGMTSEQQKAVLVFLKGMELGEKLGGGEMNVTHEKVNHLHGDSECGL